MKKSIIAIVVTALLAAGCSGLTVKATYQYPSPAAAK